MNSAAQFLIVCALAFAGSFPHSSPVWAQDEEVLDFEDLDEEAFADDSLNEESLGEDDFDEELNASESTPSESTTPTEQAAPAEPPAPAEPALTEPAPELGGREEVNESTLEPLNEAPPELAEDPPTSEEMGITTPEENLAAPEPAPTPIPESQPEEETSSSSGFANLGTSSDGGPDLEYEARLYDIYIRHLSQRTTSEEWDRVVGERTDQRYRIQRGDTLWDISQTLFGDGNYWPKIWSLNTAITNPHLIRPGNVIRFILGDETGPPAFTVTENDDGEEPVVAPVLSGTEGEPDIPPPVKRYNPVVKRLPPSLPAYQDPSVVTDQYDDAGIEYGRRKIVDLKDQIPLAAYITEEVPKGFGEVTEVETGYNLASSFQYVYVKMKPGEGNVGETYLSVMNRGAIKANRSIVPQKFLGYGIEVLGEVQLLERVSSIKKREGEGEVYRALVTKTVSPVAVGSVLIRDKIEQVDLTEKGSRSQTVAQIVGGQFSNDRKLYGPQSFAFLNRGTNDGIDIGQILPIRLNRQARDPDSQVLANIRAIGWLKVVRATPRFSTAIILRAWEGVVTGDFTGAGEMSLSQSGTSEIPPEATQTADGGSLEGEFGDGEGDSGSTGDFSDDEEIDEMTE